MTDKISKSVRSRVMSHIHDKDTLPEIRVRSLLHRLGYRFRLHRSDLPGKPDIVLPKYKAIIMVHGCFWHQHQGCTNSHIPKSNKTYWTDKLAKNVKRDAKVKNSLEALGWRVLVIWECETKDSSSLEHRLRYFLSGKE